MEARAPVQQLRQLLAERLPRVRTGFAVKPPSAVVPTGVRRLDVALGGGLPLGETTELVSEGLGSGSAQVIHAVVRRNAADGRFVALVDGADSLDVDALEPGDLGRLLWVRCRTVTEALAATDLLLRDRNFPLVVLDLKLNSATEWRRVSGSVWHRFHRLREHHRTTLLVLTARPTVGGVARRLRVSTGGSRRLGAEATGHSPAEVLDSLDFEILREMGGRGEGNVAAALDGAAGDRLPLLG